MKTLQMKPMTEGTKTASVSRTTMRSAQLGDLFLKCVAAGSYRMTAVSASFSAMSNV